MLISAYSSHFNLYPHTSLVSIWAWIQSATAFLIKSQNYVQLKSLFVVLRSGAECHTIKPDRFAAAIFLSTDFLRWPVKASGHHDAYAMGQCSNEHCASWEKKQLQGCRLQSSRHFLVAMPGGGYFWLLRALRLKRSTLAMNFRGREGLFQIWTQTRAWHYYLSGNERFFSPDYMFCTINQSINVFQHKWLQMTYRYKRNGWRYTCKLEGRSVSRSLNLGSARIFGWRHIGVSPLCWNPEQFCKILCARRMHQP